MTQKQDIIGVVKELQAIGAETPLAKRADLLALMEARDKRRIYESAVLQNFPAIAQALLIAVEALEDADKIYKRNGESSNEFFERMAAHFYEETGLMAPGKDDSLGTSSDTRQKAFDEWVERKRISTALSRIRSL